jgi:hypothetical protein
MTDVICRLDECVHCVDGHCTSKGIVIRKGNACVSHTGRLK